MNKVSNEVMNSYMDTLSIDLRKDKIKEFYRFLDNPKYFKNDSEEEIENTKNIWAGYAYLILLDKINNVTISDKEEDFLNAYYEKLLTKKPLNEYENQVNGLFIKYRLSKDFVNNNSVQFPIYMGSEEYKQGLKEYVKTIENMICSLYQDNYTLDATKTIQYNINCRGKNIKYTRHLMEASYRRFLQDDYNLSCPLDIVKEIARTIELQKLETVRRNEISQRAVVYTIEDYLGSKSVPKTKLARVYASLHTKIIKNKQIVIDSNKAVLDELKSLNEVFKKTIYAEIDTKFENYIDTYDMRVNDMHHFVSDSDFFDTNNLEKDGTSKLYQMYLNGLKAMPRSKLTNVTKYFALNGDTLTTVEMDYIIGIYKYQIETTKIESKKIKLHEEMLRIREVIKYVESLSYSYAIERAIREQSASQMTTVLGLVHDHYNDYVDMKYRVTRAYSNLDNYASSGSPSKTQGLLNKKKELKSILETCKVIDRMFDEYESLQGRIFDIDPAKDVVVRKVKDHSRIIAMMQELTGKGVSTCEEMLEASIEYGQPIIKGLKPGFKNFVEETLALKGASDFKKKKGKNK